MKPAIEWGHAVDEAVAEDIQRDVLDAAANMCEQYAAERVHLSSGQARDQVRAARTLAERLRRMKP